MMAHEKLTRIIIGCAYKVYNAMGYGFVESVYENCLMIELEKAGVSAVSQQPVHVYYGRVVVGDFVADIVVEDEVILELKSVRRIVPAHEVQLVNYLTATGKPVGLIVNFSEEKVEVRRKVKNLPSNKHGGE